MLTSLTKYSGGSRISHWGGANLQRIHFLVKTYTKTKEMDPVGGARAGGAPLDPPMKYVTQIEIKLFCPSSLCMNMIHEHNMIQLVCTIVIRSCILSRKSCLYISDD